eukprot:Hpha_TRINITY_DN15287_c1_g7::TRINITY_DN15287_c1_g7_i1::g.67972::m.67972
MSQVPADEQMRSRLQGLKASGAFSRDAAGKLPELDPEVAAELIDGEKPALFPVGSGTSSPLPGSNALDIPRSHAPLHPLRDTGAPGGSASEPVPRKGSARPSVAQKDQRHTEELMRQISTDLELFNKNLVYSFENAKHNMQRDLVGLFDTTSREKLPDSFLKSLPKFGGGATKLYQHFRQSANRKKTDSQMDRRDIPFELVVQPEVRQEISDDIHSVIDRMLKSCCGEGGTVITDLQRILKQVSELMAVLRACEKAKENLSCETAKLEEELNEKEKMALSLERTRQNLILKARTMDSEQDRTRERCLREMQLRRDRQQDYLREICRHRTQIFQMQASNQELQERLSREQKLSPRSREAAKEGRRESSSGMYGSAAAEMNFDFAVGIDSGDAAAAVEEAEKRVKGEMEEKHRSQIKDERERHMKEENKLRIKLDEQTEQCDHFKAEKLKIETELVEKTAEIRKLKKQLEELQS